MQLLPNTHLSPETAYVVNDYPYGFRLRCKIRYWIEYKASKGFRFCSQTTNPKIAGREVWNKPKASTYFDLGMAMYLDEQGHVTYAAVGEYSDLDQLRSFSAIYLAAMPDLGKDKLAYSIKVKTIYERIKAERPELHYQEVAILAIKEARKS